MIPHQRARGLLGTMLTWGVVGSLVGAAIFLARYQPWQADATLLARAIRLLGIFAGIGAAWGAACGFAFAIALWRVAGRVRFEQLSPRRFVLWGALAGAAFPGLLYGAFVLRTGLYDAIGLYATITAVSALLGALFGRVVFAIAQRAPQMATEPAVLSAADISPGRAAASAVRERVR